jgi:predicted amidophosphoribosyltransferase
VQASQDSPNRSSTILPSWHRRRLRLDRSLRWLRSCAVCHGFLPPIDLLCVSCWQSLEKNFNDSVSSLQTGYPFSVRSLLTWNASCDREVRSLIRGFKGGYSLAASARFAERLAFANARGWTADDGLPIFVYPPSSSGRPDHASVLAVELSCLWGGFPLGLAWADDPARASSRTSGLGQKGRTAIERSQRRFEDLDLASFTQPSTRWVFVDDVITTGSTAMAAYMALGSPERFEVWTLACRPKLAVGEGF